MNLVIISHKPCWVSKESPSSYVTDGGFPLQMETLSALFDQTTIVLPVHPAAPPSGTMPLVGHNLSIRPLDVPTGTGLKRRLSFLPWLLKNAPIIFREMHKSDAVHTPIPGDVGTIGMLMAFVMRKPLFVRHCGNWFNRRTTAEKFWRWFMERFAGNKNVFMATGDSLTPPSSQNPHIQWIFSTTLRESELHNLMPDRGKNLHQPPRLIIVCRQEPKKGSDVVIKSLPYISAQYPDIHLDVVGSGSTLSTLKALTREVGVEEKVTFHGHMNHDQVMCLLMEADIFCFPTSSSEGFPKAVIEALACGLPIITTPVSTLPNLVNRGVGALIDEANPLQLADAVRRVLSEQWVYEEMSSRAKRVAHEFTLEAWQKTIGNRLSQQWGELQEND